MSLMFIIRTLPVVNPAAQVSTNLLILVFTFKSVNAEDKKCIKNLAFFPDLQNLLIEQFWVEANMGELSYQSSHS